MRRSPRSSAAWARSTCSDNARVIGSLRPFEETPDAFVRWVMEINLCG